MEVNVNGIAKATVIVSVVAYFLFFYSFGPLILAVWGDLNAPPRISHETICRTSDSTFYASKRVESWGGALGYADIVIKVSSTTTPQKSVQVLRADNIDIDELSVYWTGKVLRIVVPSSAEVHFHETCVIVDGKDIRIDLNSI